jgi:hypothetical protein
LSDPVNRIVICPALCPVSTSFCCTCAKEDVDGRDDRRLGKAQAPDGSDDAAGLIKAATTQSFSTSPRLT